MYKKIQNKNNKKSVAILVIIIFFFSGLNAQDKIDTKIPTETNSVEKEKPKEIKSEKAIPDSYKSDQKGNMHIEHLRSVLVTPEQMGALRKSEIFWMDDKLKVGFHIRPRFESRQNADFNRNTDDYSTFTGQNTQLWFFLDPSPYYSAKVTIQDARLWGGNQNPGAGGDSSLYSY